MKDLEYQTKHLKKLGDQDGAPWCKAFFQQQLELLKFCILPTPSRSRLTKGSSAFDAKDHDKVIKNTIMIMKTSKKRSVQGRVPRAILVNGLPASRVDALKMDGIITLV